MGEKNSFAAVPKRTLEQVVACTTRHWAVYGTVNGPDGTGKTVALAYRPIAAWAYAEEDSGYLVVGMVAGDVRRESVPEPGLLYADEVPGFVGYSTNPGMLGSAPERNDPDSTDMERAVTYYSKETA